jgi:FkbM family methyltransferase
MILTNLASLLLADVWQWDQQLLPRRPDAFLIAFEPLIDKWSLMLARHSRARVVGELGWHNSRGIILPFAVSDRSGVVPFYVSPRDGCSSLRKTHRPERGGWRSNGFVRNACAKTVQVRHVPAITLATVLGEWLPGWRVAKLKIDAQGSDLGVLMAAGASLLRRVDEVSMETLHDSCDGIYESQPNCSTVVREMDGLGFVPQRGFRCSAGRFFTQGSGCEANVVFNNKAVDLLGRPASTGGGAAAAAAAGGGADDSQPTWRDPAGRGRGREGRGSRGGRGRGGRGRALRAAAARMGSPDPAQRL